MGIYGSLEDKYYNFLDWLDARGIPLIRVAEALENRGIPSFPVAAIILLAIIALIGWLSFGFLVPQNAHVTLTLVDGEGNPVSNVLVEFQGIELAAKSSDSEGKIAFDAPMGKEFYALVKSDEWAAESTKILPDRAELAETISLAEKTNALKKTIKLVSSKDSSKIIEKTVVLEFSCSDNSDYKSTKTTSTGEIVLNDVPLDCGMLYVKAKNGFSLREDYLDSEEKSSTLHLSETPTEKGSVLVTVKDSEGSLLAGKKIILVLSTSDGDASYATGYSSSSGTKLFEEVLVGKYFVQSIDEAGEFYASDTEKKEVQPNARTEFNVTMQRTTVGHIKVLALDKAAQAVQGAKIELRKTGSAVVLQTKTTNAEGKAEFSVGENVKYDLLVDHSSYLVEVLKEVSPAETYYTVSLEKATPENSNTLEVRVKDEFSAPVESAQVLLRKAETGEVAGAKQSTGANGIARFLRLEEGSYYAEVVKPGFGEETSSIVRLLPRQENVLEVQLAIGTGRINITVLDEDMQAIAGATVSAYDFYYNEKIGSDYSTDSGGVKEITLRADKKAFFAVKAQDYLAYHTIAVQVAKDSTIEMQVKMVKGIAKLEAKFLGLFVQGEEVRDSLSPGQKYTAKIQLLIPENSGFQEAGIHIRTGSDEQTMMEADSLYIRGVFAPSSSQLKGKSYNAPNNYALDAQHLTNGDSKWASVWFENPEDGVYEVEAEIQVRDSAPRGSALEIHYRGWGKAGGIVRHPVDAVLGSAESSAAKQGLYANTLAGFYSVGPSSYCTDNFCSVFSVLDIGEGIQTAVFDSFDAIASNNYKLNFTISNYSSTTYAAGQLKINTGSGLKLGNYSITTAAGQAMQGTAQQELSIPVGAISEGSIVRGSIEFSTQKDGTNKLEIEIVSGQEKAYYKAISVNIAPAKDLFVSIVPKTLVPYINNNVLLKVTEDLEEKTAVQNAIVNVYVDGSPANSGETDSDGVYGFTLNAPSNGAVVKITVEKTGFKLIEIQQTVSESIISSIPEAISEILTINGEFEKQRAIALINSTAIPLTVENIEASSHFSNLVELEFDPNPEGSIIAPGKDFNTTITITLTKAGKLIEKPKTIDGSINLALSNTTIGNWTAKIPLKIRIGFGKQVDTPNCLAIEPNSWNVFTSKEQKTIELSLNNECYVNGEPIALRSLQAKIKWGNSNEIGTFSVSSDLENSKTITLSGNFKEIAAIVPEKSESLLTFYFNPADIESGDSKPEITIMAVNKTEKEDEEITARLQANVKVNDLAKCVKIIGADNVTLETTPYNTGYGNYGQYPGNFSGNPYNAWGYSPSSSLVGAGYIGTSQQLAYANYPGAYRSPYYDATNYNPAYNAGFGAAGMGYAQGYAEFRIENTCSSAVEINLQPSSGLNIKQNSFTVEPTKDAKITIESGYRVGKFKIDVEAKVKGSGEASKNIGSVNVVIRSSWEVNEYCIQLDRTKFSFNDFFGRPVKARIYNTCYDSGVRLTRDASTIQLFEGTAPAGTAFNTLYQNPTQMSSIYNQYSQNNPAYDSSKNPYGYLGYENSPAMVKGIIVTGLFTQEGAMGAATQVLEFEIDRSIMYINQNPLQHSQLPFEDLGHLRYFGQKAYYRVQSRATLTVQYFSAYGQIQARPFNVTLEDSWAAGEFFDAMMKRGNLSLRNSQECINDDALRAIFNDRDFSENPVHEGVKYLDTDRIEWIPNTDESKKVMRIGPQHCGGQDYLSDLKPTTDTSSDGKLSLEFRVKDGQNVKVIIDRSSLGENETDVYEKDLKAKLTRTEVAREIEQVQNVVIPVNIKVVRGKGGIVTPGTEVKPCKDSGYEKGKDVLPKILFDWSWDNFAKTYKCDSGTTDYVYCDAAQFSIELNAKAAKLKEVWVPLAGTEGTGKGAFLEVDKSMGSKTAADYKDSENLFRFAKAQIKVKDDVSGKDLVFFLNADSRALQCEKIDAGTANVQQYVTSFNQYFNSKDWVNSVAQIDGLLRDIKQEYKDYIIAEIVPDKLSQPTKDTLKDLGASLPEGVSSGVEYKYLVMTFSEFKRMHETIYTTEACKTAAAECTIKLPVGTTTKDVTITTTFLNEVYSKDIGNIIFKLGVRSEEGIAKAKKECVMKYGKDFPGVAEKYKPEYETMDKFYYENIEFSSYLIKDAYTEDFRKDFAAYYGASALDKFGEWKFDTLSEPGLWKVLLNYKPAGGTEVKFSGRSWPKDERENVFYSLPFDGKIGLDSGRTGYGVSFNGKSEPNIKLYKIVSPAEYVGAESGYGSSGLVNLKPTYSKEYEKTKEGQVLKLNTSEILYTPSSPVVLTMEVKAGTPAKTGVEFTLESGREAEQSPLFVWDNAAESTTTLCGENLPGIASIFKSGTFNTTAFVPMNKPYTLTLNCAFASAKAEAEDKLNNVSDDAQVTGMQTDSMALNKAREPPTFNELFDLVKDEKLCTKSSATETLFKWEDPGEWK